MKKRRRKAVKWFNRTFSFGIALLLVLPSLVQANDKIAAGIDNILRHNKEVNLNNVNVAIVVQSMQNGKVLYQRNADRLYSPASVLKLFTAAAALDYLKPNYIYRTQVLITGPIKDGALDGDLFVKFTGDPQLKIKNLKELLHQLKRSGLKTIKGRVFVDNTDYSFVPYPPGWIWDDLTYSYAAPMNAIILNHNMFGMHFEPGEKTNDKPRIWSDLPKGVIKINNLAKTITKHDKFCPLTIYSDIRNQYTISGCLEKHRGTQHRHLALRDVAPYGKALVRDILHEEEVQYKGPIKIKRAPSNAFLLAEYESKDLNKIVHKMLKDSDNLATNSVFKKLGQVYFGSPGSWQNALQALQKILGERTGINFENNLLADGSGLSRYNLITARQLSKLLYFAYHNHDIQDPFVKALPVAGRDGTLIGRMLSFGRSGRIRAKTGTMTGVTSLAGYAYTKNHGVLSFAIMINGFVKSRRPYTHLQDKICEFLVNANAGGNHRG